MITKGQSVTIRPEWQDKGDDQYQWVAVSDEEKGRVDIRPLGTGLSIPPLYTVTVAMLATEN